MMCLRASTTPYTDIGDWVDGETRRLRVPSRHVEGDQPSRTSAIVSAARPAGCELDAPPEHEWQRHSSSSTSADRATV